VLEESNVSCWVPAKFHYAKLRSVVHGIKRILNVQVQQDHRMLGVALIIEKTLKLKELTLRAATFAESFRVLHIFKELVALHERRRLLVENVEENAEFGTDARNRPELKCHVRPQLLHRLRQ
jgi:hypothetical protein